MVGGRGGPGQIFEPHGVQLLDVAVCVHGAKCLFPGAVLHDVRGLTEAGKWGADVIAGPGEGRVSRARCPRFPPGRGARRLSVMRVRALCAFALAVSALALLACPNVIDPGPGPD